MSRYFNRPISSRISARVAGYPITPDQWSWAAFGAACAGGLAFALRAPRLAAVLVHMGSVLDGVDGEVARRQGTASAAGALLDLVLDRTSDVAILAGMAQGAGGTRLDWLLALAATNGALVSGIAKERVGAEHLSVSQLQVDESRQSGLDRLLPWTGRDGRLFAVALVGLARRPRIGLVWLAFSSNFRLVRRLRAARVMLRRAGESSRP